MKAFWTELNLPVEIGKDPLLLLLGQVFPNIQSLSYIDQFFSILVLTFTTSLFFNRQENRFLNSWVIALCIFSIFGFSPLFLRLHWYPLFLYAINREEKSIPNIFLLIISSLLWVLSSGDLAVAGVLFAFVFAKNALSFISLIPLVLGLYFLPKGIPNMPTDGNYGVISSYSFLRFPPLGTWYGKSYLNISNFFILNQILLLRFLLVFSGIFIFVLNLKSSINKDSFSKSFYPLCLFMAFSFLLIGSVFYPLTKYGDTLYFLLAGLVPNLAYLYSPFFLISIISIPVLILIFKAVSISKKALPWLIIILLSAPFIEKEYYGKSLDQLLSISTYKNDISHRKQVMLSPSANVVNYYGDWVLDNLEILKDFSTLKPISLEGAKVSAFNSPNVNELTDLNPKTFWSTARAQKEGDWLKIEFPQKIQFSVVSLSPGKNHTDFPRDITLYADSKEVPLYNENISPQWLGALGVSKNGFPHFRGQSDVIFYLPQTVTAKELKFVLRGGDEKFHWSVSDIRLFDQPRNTETSN